MKVKTYIMSNQRKSISDPSSIHMLHIRHHQDPSNTPTLETRQDSNRMKNDSPSLLLVAQPRGFGRGGFPVLGHTHRVIGSYRIVRLG